MKASIRKSNFGQSSLYQIQVQGRLYESWSSWFNNLTIIIDSKVNHPTITTLTGFIADQSALHGVLARIRDLNLPLLLVRYIKPQEPDGNTSTCQCTQ